MAAYWLLLEGVITYWIRTLPLLPVHHSDYVGRGIVESVVQDLMMRGTSVTHTNLAEVALLRYSQVHNVRLSEKIEGAALPPLHCVIM